MEGYYGLGEDDDQQEVSDTPLKSIAESTVNIMGIEVTVHVLSDGQRVFEAEGAEKLLELIFGGAEMTEGDAMKLAKVVKGA